VNHTLFKESEQNASVAELERQKPDQQLAKAKEQRRYRRFACAVKVSVEIPFLPTMFFAVRNLSRKGMFLAFTEECLGKHELDENLIGKGKHLVILLAVTLHGIRHQCHIRARINRVTQCGIAVEFGDRNPWQLNALVDAYSRAYPKADSA